MSYNPPALPPLQHVVMFSGGLGSWAAATRVIAQHGTVHVTLLFTDTLMEDEDLYRFLDEAAVQLGVPITWIAEGRTPWQVFFDKRFLGNSLVDPCSRILKRERCDDWLTAHCDPARTICYVGIDWSEEHRFTKLATRHAAEGWTYQAPMCDPPYLTKTQMAEQLAAAGLTLPYLYTLGFAHNNCGGFCVKAGQGHFAKLLETMPDRYRWHEAMEQEIRAFLGKDVSILTDRRGDGKKKPLTLKAFRESLEAGGDCDRFEIGGCGCFSGVPETEGGSSRVV